jgi:hypothetical protein
LSLVGATTGLGECHGCAHCSGRHAGEIPVSSPFIIWANPLPSCPRRKRCSSASSVGSSTLREAMMDGLGHRPDPRLGYKGVESCELCFDDCERLQVR